ncbi:MAG: CHAT domain-containing tetratricopeptide repeat protein [Micropepsaceae bacterium]
MRITVAIFAGCLSVAMAFETCTAIPVVVAAETSRAPVIPTTEDSEQQQLRVIDELREDGRYDEARALAERGLSGAEAKHGRNHAGVAKWLRALGKTLSDQGNAIEAESVLKRALAINEKSRGPNARETAESLGDLGQLFINTNRFAEAEPLLKRALEIAEKYLGPQDAETSNSLGNLANLYATQGRLSEAEHLYLRASAIDEKLWGPDHHKTAENLYNLAQLYYEAGRYAEAEILANRALANDEKHYGPEHLRISADLNSLALIYQEQGRFAESEILFLRALAICERKLGDHFETSTMLNNLGNLFIDQGRLTEAEPPLKRALAISEKTLGYDDPDTAASVNLLAALYSSQGRKAEALQLYARSLASLEKTLGPVHPRTASALNNYGSILADQGRLTEAEQLIKRALSIDDKTLPPDHPNRRWTISNLAGVYMSGGRLAEAEPLLRRSLAALEKHLPADHIDIGLESNDLSRCLLGLGKTADALSAAGRAAKIVVGTRRQSFSQQLRGGWRSDFVYDYVFVQQIRASHHRSLEAPPEADKLLESSFEAAQRVGIDDTGRALANMASRIAAGNGELERLLREQQDLLRRLRAFDRLLSNAMGSSDPATHEQAENFRRQSEAISTRLNDIDITLSRDHKAYGDLADPTPLTLIEAQDLLRPDEAIVVFVPADEKVFLFAVSRSKAVWAVAPVGYDDLTKRVATLRSQLDPDQWLGSALPPFDRALAYRLYRDLWAPLENVLRDKSQVFVIPSGPLSGIPLSVLVTELPPDGSAGDAKPQSLRDTAWLAKRYALTTLPSISSLKALRVYASKGSGGERFAGFGDPTFAAPASQHRGSRSVASVYRGTSPDINELRQLEPLPATAGELRALAKALGASVTADVYLRERATEAQIKSLDLSRKRVIAFATHGLMAGDMGLGEPGLVFTPPGTPSERDDGYLSASEVAGLNLKADWIILSACNTASGDTPGAKGLSGLARAFFLAGSKSLLVSHWPVWDTAAMKLTTGTVANMQKNPAAGRAEALRQSMLTLMNDRSAPYYAHPATWAPFVLVGETR